MKILFPSEPFSPKEVDSSFKAEYEAAKIVGFKTFLFDHDEFIRDNKITTDLPVNKDEDEDELVMLRSWMLKDEQYATLYGRLFGRGYSLINTPKEYLNTHHFPEYSTYIQNHSTKSTWGPSWTREILDMTRKYLFSDGECDILIKDYVKSEKGNPDLFILKKELTLDEFQERVEKFVEARGKLFNKGLVFKKVVSLKKYEDETNEWRIFFFKNKLLTCNQNSDNPKKVSSPPADMLNICETIAGRWIDSNLFTMDIVEKEDGSWMILELGDGQVSGLPLKGCELGFYNKVNNVLNKVEA